MEKSISIDEQHSSTLIKKEGLLIALLSFLITMTVMNVMMFNLAVPQIIEDLTITTTAAAWMITGYSIVIAATTLAFTRLSDYLPIRSIFLGGTACLGLASIVGYFSHAYIALIIVRVIQSIGAGALTGSTFIFVSRYIPIKRRGKALAYIFSGAAFGLGLGPVLGGVITHYLGWNFLFFVTGSVLFLFPFFYFSIPKEKGKKVFFDYYGVAFITLGIASFLLFVTNVSYVALGCSVVLLYLFWKRIHRVKNPFIQPELVHNKNFMLITFINMISNFINFGLLFLLPQVLVYAFRLTEAQAGFIIFPGAVITLLLSKMIGALVDRYGNRLVLRYFPWIIMLAMLTFSLFGHHSSYIIMVAFILISIGTAGLNTSVTNEATVVLPQNQRGVGIGVLNMAQMLGSAFSVSLIGSAITFQMHLPIMQGYNHIFWGMTAVVVVGVIVSSLYLLRVNGHKASRL